MRSFSTFRQMCFVKTSPNRSTHVPKAYRCGKAASKIKLHSQEMMLAQVESPLAIENAHCNLLGMEDDE